MPQKPENSAHPGAFIREHVIPTGMSVTEAAKRLGVGRPALSNLLNANSSLSPDMAVRLEKTFGADRQKLLDLQAAFDRHDRREEEKSIAVHAYVPAFLTIKARQIQDWADYLNARQMLPVLLRKLIHSTGQDLRQVDFPGYDNAERKGWDGLIEAGAATPWIPEGKSGWEFGVNQNPRNKAESDYAARIRSVSRAERRECTFVFVTPRNWSGKTEWARSKHDAGDWKAVRAFDASDLEQWLEESIPAQIWLAETLDMPVDRFKTLDGFWQSWAAASDPIITPAIFEPSIIAYRSTLKEWLEKQSERPFVVTADSKDEAIAFLACLFQDSAIAEQWGDLAVVFRSAQTLQKLAASPAPFIPIVGTEAAERELATIYRRRHCIVVHPRNAIDSKPDIALDLLDHDSFVKALAMMGIERDEAERLARESGRSPTILRRRLSKIDAIRTPLWAGDAGVARSLIPMALIGAWHAQSSADHEVFDYPADSSYQKIEESVARLLQIDDSPVWSAGQHRGVASKTDALFAINKHVTQKDLADFFFLAEYVLSETDPALELPEDNRGAAELYGKVRDHSSALREGICETLVILSVHGNNLFQERLGIDLDARVSSLIHRLLTPLTLEKLLSHNNDLPRYAEAAPDAFMTLFEADLQQTRPVVLGLLKPADSTPVFGSCPRTGLLGALECLAWKDLGRVSMILARLSKTVIYDNWANKPISSLGAIYRSRMPQTAASLEDRMSALEMLTKWFPDIGWQICVEQLNAVSSLGYSSYRPRWRSDAAGAGQPVTGEEIREFTCKALDLALEWPKHDQKTLGDLVERVQRMPEKDQAAVWELIEAWAASEVDDNAKAGLAERIRRFALTRSGQRRGLNDATKDRARMAYANLQPRDPVVRHAWLFANSWIELSADDIGGLALLRDAFALHNSWIELSADDIGDGDIDYDKREERIYGLRAAAMNEIWGDRGFEGVTTLLSGGGVADVIGRSLALGISGANARADFLRICLAVTDGLERKADGCIEGFLRSVSDEARGEILSAVAEGAETDRTLRLFLCAPFGQNTWRLLDQYGKEFRGRYWQKVFPPWSRHSEAELIEIIDRLLEAKRPRAALHVASRDLNWPKIETSRLKRLLLAAAPRWWMIILRSWTASRLKRLLLAVAPVDAEPAEPYRLDDYQISEALNSLDGRIGVSPDEMAQLEFLYIDALDRSEHGIPNLERQIAESPSIFVQVLTLVCKRRDQGQDPPEWRIDDPERRAGLALARCLLDQMKHIPGTGTDGKVDTKELLAWVTEVRRLCAEHDRAEIGDEYIGQLLSKAPAEEDGTWPCLPVCEVLERIASPHIGIGFGIGVQNRSGSQVHGKGGAQERDLAAEYRSRAKQRAFDYPYVSGVLESIAVDCDGMAKWWDDKAEIEKRRGT